MLLVLVAEDLAELLEVLCAADTLCETVLVRLGYGRTDEEMEDGARAVVEPFDDRLWEEGDDEGEDGFEGDENTAEDEGSVVSCCEPTEKG